MPINFFVQESEELYNMLKRAKYYSHVALSIIVTCYCRFFLVFAVFCPENIVNLFKIKMQIIYLNIYNMMCYNCCITACKIILGKALQNVKISYFL